jgi:ABC-type bacteriocin/lantibiotic exporter with double-glycine peptidase domain
MNGLILLTIPVGIQALIGFAQTSTASASIVLLIILVVLSVFVAGILQIKQMQLTEKIQQKIFVRYSFEIANKIPALKLTAVDNYYLPELINRFFDIGTLQRELPSCCLIFHWPSFKLFLDYYYWLFIILFSLPSACCCYWLLWPSYIFRAPKIRK